MGVLLLASILHSTDLLLDVIHHLVVCVDAWELVLLVVAEPHPLLIVYQLVSQIEVIIRL